MSVKPCDDTATLEAAIAAAGEKLIIIDFHATWCGPCRRIAPALTKLAQAMPDVVFLKVDVDKNTEATEKYEVEAMPTFKLIKGGTVVTTVMGADEAAIEAALNQHK